MTGLVVLVALLLFAIVGPYVTGYDEETIDMMNMLAKPGNGHTLGTDELGRDILTRLANGGRVSISVGIFATLMELLIGVLLGSIAGLYGGIVESVIMRITDIIMCFPFFVIALSIAAITGPSFRNLIFIIGILGWPSVCREASLSFLGLGIARPQSSWGTMLSAAQNMQILKDCWWMWVPAGMLVLLTVLSINFLGDGLAEVLDPKSRGTGGV